MSFSCGIPNDFIANTNRRNPIVLAMHKLVVIYKTHTDTNYDMLQKAYKHIDEGYQMICLVYPDKKIVEVFQPDKNFTHLVEGDTLDGGDVLPGFRLAVETLFR